MSWARLGFVSPVEGQHWPHSGSTLRPDEGLNGMASNLDDGRDAFLLRHREGGGHDDPLVAVALVILEWDSDSQRFVVEDSDAQIIDVESDPAVPGLATVCLRSLYSGDLWVKASLRSSDLASGVGAVQVSPRAVQIQTYRQTWDSTTGAPGLEPWGYDVSLELKYEA